MCVSCICIHIVNFSSQLRRSKLLEEERRMLLKGLQSVDKAKEWYTKRLAEVADKQRYGAPDTSDQSTTDQQQERINFEQLRINEVGCFVYWSYVIALSLKFKQDFSPIMQNFGPVNKTRNKFFEFYCSLWNKLWYQNSSVSSHSV